MTYLIWDVSLIYVSFDKRNSNYGLSVFVSYRRGFGVLGVNFTPKPKPKPKPLLSNINTVSNVCCIKNIPNQTIHKSLIRPEGDTLKTHNRFSN